MSMTEIDNMVRGLGYDRVISYWYSVPIYNNGGLTKLNDDQDVIDMLVFVPETRLIDIFLHHGVDSNEGYLYSQLGSNLFVDVEADIVPNKGVVIEELDDNYGAIVPIDSLDSDFAYPNFNCDYNDDDVNFDEWVDKQTEWDGHGAKGKEPESTNAGVESWDWGEDVELDSEGYDSDNV
ncbi:unnamed protein product [Prunus brigantina]